MFKMGHIIVFQSYINTNKAKFHYTFARNVKISRATFNPALE